MSILCVIPARKGSKEVKNKNWKKINGKHLIEYTFDAVKKSKKINKTIVSTNDPAIIKLCIKHKINYIKRPKLISGPKSKTIEAVNHVLKKIDYIPKYIVILQPTSPLRKANHIDNAIKKITSSKNADSLVSCVKVSHNFYPPSLMTIKKNGFLKFRNQLIRRQEQKKVFYARNGAAIYITKYPLIKKTILGKSLIPFEMNQLESLDINTLEDFKLANKLLK